MDADAGMPEPGSLPGPEVEKPGFLARRLSMKTVIWIAAASLVLGVSMGGAGSSSVQEAGTEAVAALASVEQRAEAADDRIESLEKQLSSRDARLSRLQDELDAARLKVTALESAALQAEKSKPLPVAEQPKSSSGSSKDSGLSKSSGSSKSSSKNSASGKSSGSSKSSVYYKNCAAVRAAGAAPVLRGQPGYGRHLDRDNDGIGCE